MWSREKVRTSRNVSRPGRAKSPATTVSHHEFFFFRHRDALDAAWEAHVPAQDEETWTEEFDDMESRDWVPSQTEFGVMGARENEGSSTSGV